MRAYSGRSTRTLAPVRASGVVVAILLVAAGCRPSQPAHPAAPSARRPTGAPSTSAVPPATAPVPAGGTSGPDIVTLLAGNVRLFDAENADNGFRIAVDSAAAAVSIVLSGIPTPNRAIFVCPTAGLDQRAARSACTNPTDGEPSRLPFGSDSRGVEVVQLGAAGTGPTASSTPITTIALTFTPRSRQVGLRLPPLRAGTAGEPASFRLSPAGTTGAYRATATWASPTGAAPGRAMLSLLGAGPGTHSAEGGPGVTLSGTLAAPGDATIRLRNSGTTTLDGVTLTALFP